MKYKLFLSDYDRTLGDREHIDESTLQAIKKYQSCGGKFCIISGRVVDSISEICKTYGFGGLVGAYQGSMIKDLDTGKILYDYGLPKDIAIDVYKDFVGENYDTTVDIAGVRYSIKADGVFLNRYKEFGGAIDNLIDKEEGLRILESTVKPIEKICAMIPPEDIYTKIALYSEKYPKDVAFNSGGPIILECINAKYNKGYAARFIAEYYGIPFSEVIAIGDSTNDIPLVDGKWYGVAVGDGCEQIKHAANEVAVEFSKNPVKQILEKYCL